MPSMDKRRAGRADAAGRRIALVASAATLVALSSVAIAATISFRVARNPDALDIEASALLDVDAQTAWRVLTDYERYPRFIPHVRSTRIVSRAATEVVVEQKTDATIWGLSAPLDVTYRIDEHPPTRIVSRATAAGMPTLESVYTLTRTPHGVRLDYHGRVWRFVTVVGAAEAGERSVERAFRALVDEIERASAGVGQPADTGTPVEPPPSAVPTSALPPSMGRAGGKPVTVRISCSSSVSRSSSAFTSASSDLRCSFSSRFASSWLSWMILRTSSSMSRAVSSLNGFALPKGP
jgi:hypothetical protein